MFFTNDMGWTHSTFPTATSRTFDKNKNGVENSARCDICRVMQPVSRISDLSRADVMPSGSTPLLDATGLTLRNILSQYAGKNFNVALVIVTDGEENTSTEFDTKKVASLSKEAQDAGMLLMYLGANQDAWATGGGMGFSRDTTADYKMSNMSQTFRASAASTMRYANSGGGAVGLASATLTSAERASMTDVNIENKSKDSSSAK